MVFDEACEALDIEHNFYCSIFNVLVCVADRWYGSCKDGGHCQSLVVVVSRLTTFRGDFNPERVDKLEEQSQLG